MTEVLDWNKVAYQVFSVHSNGWLHNITKDGDGKARAIRAAQQEARKRKERCYVVEVRTGNVCFITNK